MNTDKIPASTGTIVRNVHTSSLKVHAYADADTPKLSHYNNFDKINN